MQIVETNVLGTMLGCKEVGCTQAAQPTVLLELLVLVAASPSAAQATGRPLLSLCLQGQARALAPHVRTPAQLLLRWPRAVCICMACAQA